MTAPALRKFALEPRQPPARCIVRGSGRWRAQMVDDSAEAGWTGQGHPEGERAPVPAPGHEIAPSPLRLLVVGAESASGLFPNMTESGGLDIRASATISEAVHEVLTDPPDAVVLLGDEGEAAEQCAVLRALGEFPLAVVPRLLSEQTVVACLDEGADIALTQPIPGHELVARLRTVLRRTSDNGPVLQTGRLRIDVPHGEVTLGGDSVSLTPTELRLLGVLAEHAGQVVAAEDLLRAVWGDDYVNDLHYVRLYIGYLRAKLEEDPAHPQLIVTHRSLGYRLALQPPSD